jgi:trehalose synthase
LQGLEDYREIVGDEVISEIYRKVRPLYGKHILHINSTYHGGGVAEILNSKVPLMNDAGVDAGWRILPGNPEFFAITKKFHNALQGGELNLTEIKKKLYFQASEVFSAYTHIDHDCVVVHDPQPLPLIEYYKKRQPWLWRCHVDLSHPNKEVWNFLKPIIQRYDLVLLSHDSYRQPDLPVEQRICYPAIDPLSIKNMELPEKVTAKYRRKLRPKGPDKPIISQVSRYDIWKDPEGVVDVFRLVKEKVDCRLVLCGNSATDDPEGMEVLEAVRKKAADLVETGDVILLTEEGNIFSFVNTLQRSSSVVIQKSIKEGFCLAVTEALWKEVPVVGSKVGGIPLQIVDGENGFLVEPNDVEGFADRIVTILKDAKLRKAMGARGKEIVREKFLITRLIGDYLDIMSDILR